MLLLCALGGGCVHAPLGRESGAVDLGGVWVLDASASDDAAKLIAAAAPAPPPPPSRPAGPDPYAFGTPQPVDQGGQGGRRGGAGQGSSQQERVLIEDKGPRLRPSDRLQFVRAVALPSQTVEILQQPDHVAIVQGDRRREFEPGAPVPVSVTDRYGTRRVHAGWRGGELVIDSEDPSHVSLTEIWRAGPAADTIEFELTLKAWNYKKVHVRALYRRAQGPIDPAPAGEGPPVRSPR